MLRPQVFPILEYDEDPHALINPSDHFSAGVLPERAVLCFFPDVMHMLQEEDELTEMTRLQGEYGQAPIYRIQRHNQEIALLNPLVGAPLAAGNLEEAIALGARKILACGGGGRIRKELTAGHLLLPTEAVRDEGMSYHYLPPSRTVVLNPRCVEAVAEFLKEAASPSSRARPGPPTPSIGRPPGASRTAGKKAVSLWKWSVLRWLRWRSSAG